MNIFKDKIAIVTGGACGIGRALCNALAQRGAIVIVADINAEGAQQVAATIAAAGGRASAVSLDVTQVEQVQKLVERTADQNGRLDYMFNNAGIGIVGEVRDMGLEHWQRILGVNLWGVIYGTVAAYKVMVGQGFGHIVNTASAAGLFPVPMGVAYATTKYGVVGLSTSLRPEAAALGVKVSVVCPGVIRTGMFDAVTVVKINYEQALADALTKFKLTEPDDCAHVILRGVERDQAIIPVTTFAHVLWRIYRLWPSLAVFLFNRMAGEFRKFRVEGV